MPSVQIPPIPFSSVAFFMDIVILLDTPEEGLVLSCERVICYKTSLLQPVPEDSAMLTLQSTRENIRAFPTMPVSIENRGSNLVHVRVSRTLL